MNRRVMAFSCVLLTGCGTQPLYQPDLMKAGDIPSGAALEIVRGAMGSHPFVNRASCRLESAEVTSIPGGQVWRYADLHLWGEDNGGGWWLLLADAQPQRTSSDMSDILNGKRPGCFLGAVFLGDAVAAQAEFDRAVTAWVSLGGRLKADD